MSRATVRHFHKTNSCPECGSRVNDTRYGTITTYWCTNRECDWELDWATPEKNKGAWENRGVWEAE